MMTPHYVARYLLSEEIIGSTTNRTRRSMNEMITITDHFDESGLYEIRLKGHLNGRWAEWFSNATITLEDDGNTLIICPVIDQAALHGLIRKIRDLGIPLLSVNFIKPDQDESKEAIS
jgi:hypothetical protein